MKEIFVSRPNWVP